MKKGRKKKEERSTDPIANLLHSYLHHVLFSELSGCHKEGGREERERRTRERGALFLFTAVIITYALQDRDGRKERKKGRG